MLNKIIILKIENVIKKEKGKYPNNPQGTSGWNFPVSFCAAKNFQPLPQWNKTSQPFYRFLDIASDLFTAESISFLVNCTS